MGSRGAALITGAARRIGRELALEAARAGYDVAIHHRSGRLEAQSLAEEIRAFGRAAVLVLADLSDEAQATSLVRQASDAVGPLTLLVNNASVFDDDRVGALDRACWDRHFDTNLRAPVVLSEAFAAQAQGEGNLIVNILDQRVWKPNPQFFTYSLTKHALWMATQMLAQALAPRIRVNGIGPGPTLVSKHQSEDDFGAEAAAVPLGRRATPAAIAGALRYLIDAELVTGQMIAVDGGQHLAWRTPDIVSD